MSAAKKHRSAVKEERRTRRRRRKVAAATSTMLLVAAAVAGEPMSFADVPTQAVAGAGGGLIGLTDPSTVGASGEANEDDAVGDEVLAAAGDLDRLLKLGRNDALPLGAQGLPGNMLDAYRNAADMLASAQPGCNLHWSLLASIGRIESNHARGGRADAAGNTVPQILGPVLNGGGFAAIQDTDGGRLDGDARWDRAVGPMQFIPSTWRGYASDGNADGVSSPHNIWDATLASGKYLCSGGMDMADPKDRAAAVFRYNHSTSYVTTVLIWAEAYRNGTPILPATEVQYPDNQALGPGPIVQQPGAQPPAGKPKPKPSPKPTPTTPPSSSIPTTTPPSSSTTTTESTPPSCPTTTESTETESSSPEPTGDPTSPSGEIGSSVVSTTTEEPPPSPETTEPTTTTTTTATETTTPPPTC